MIPVSANSSPDNRSSLQDADCKPFLEVANYIAGVSGAFIAPAGTDPGNAVYFPLDLSPHCYGQLCIPDISSDGLNASQHKALADLAAGLARMFAAKKQFAAPNGTQTSLTDQTHEKLAKQRH